MKFVQSVKDNPIVSILTGFILLMTTITGTLTATGQLDALVLTESEFETIFADHNGAMHPTATEAVDELKAWNRCVRLEDQLHNLDDRLWRVQQSPDADPQTIRDIEKDIDALEQRFDALKCDEVLAE